VADRGERIAVISLLMLGGVVAGWAGIGALVDLHDEVPAACYPNRSLVRSDVARFHEMFGDWPHDLYELYTGRVVPAGGHVEASRLYFGHEFSGRERYLIEYDADSHASKCRTW
jgi:hypothetical protein